MTAKNPFPSQSPLQKVILQELARVAERCYDRGWSWGTAGNFSIRGSNGIIWQSPTGLCKGELDPDLFIPVDLATEAAVEPCSSRPSAEMPVHAGIYKNASEAQCVVHTHPHEAVAATFGRTSLVFEGEEMAKALGANSHTDRIEIPVLDNPSPDQMKNYSSQVVAGIRLPARMIVLQGHGVYAWGKTPLEAMAYLEALEFLCQSQRFRR